MIAAPHRLPPLSISTQVALFSMAKWPSFNLTKTTFLGILRRLATGFSCAIHNSECTILFCLPNGQVIKFLFLKIAGPKPHPLPCGFFFGL